MKPKHWLGGATVALAFGVMSASAEAAPLGGAAENLKATAGENAAVQEVTYYGYRRRYYRYYYHGPRYY